MCVWWFGDSHGFFLFFLVLREVGSAFLTHREVGAQEAVYRLLLFFIAEDRRCVCVLLSYCKASNVPYYDVRY